MGVLLHFQSQQKWRGWSHCHLWWQRRLGVGHGPVVATNGLGSNGNRTGRRYRRYIKIPNKDLQTLHFLNGQHDLFCLFCSFRMFTSVPAWGPKAGWQEVQHQISVKVSRRVEESKSRIYAVHDGCFAIHGPSFPHQSWIWIRQTSGVHGLCRGQWRSVTKICRTGRTASE